MKQYNWSRGCKHIASHRVTKYLFSRDTLIPLLVSTLVPANQSSSQKYLVQYSSAMTPWLAAAFSAFCIEKYRVSSGKYWTYISTCVAITKNKLFSSSVNIPNLPLPGEDLILRMEGKKIPGEKYCKNVDFSLCGKQCGFPQDTFLAQISPLRAT